jgi:hypothetical protein
VGTSRGIRRCVTDPHSHLPHQATPRTSCICRAATIGTQQMNNNYGYPRCSLLQNCDSLSTKHLFLQRNHQYALRHYQITRALPRLAARSSLPRQCWRQSSAWRCDRVVSFLGYNQREDCSSSSSITAYLTKTNVQLGASYHTGTQSNTKYEEGYQAAAKYMNAGRDEIGNSI